MLTLVITIAAMFMLLATTIAYVKASNQVQRLEIVIMQQDIDKGLLCNEINRLTS